MLILSYQILLTGHVLADSSRLPRGLPSMEHSQNAEDFGIELYTHPPASDP